MKPGLSVVQLTMPFAPKPYLQRITGTNACQQRAHMIDIRQPVTSHRHQQITRLYVDVLGRTPRLNRHDDDPRPTLPLPLKPPGRFLFHVSDGDPQSGQCQPFPVGSRRRCCRHGCFDQPPVADQPQGDHIAGATFKHGYIKVHPLVDSQPVDGLYNIAEPDTGQVCGTVS